MEAIALTGKDNGTKLKLYRTLKNVTQDTLGKACGYTSGMYISMMEKGQKPCSDEKLKQILEALDKI
jgi:transcriptional regulator with XRE-family HTH domain